MTPDRGPSPETGCGEPNDPHPEWETWGGSKSVPRWFMSPLIWLLIVWGVLTAILIVLLIYRSTLTMQEDDQLFLNESESHMQTEQTELLMKVNRITPVVKILGAVSGVMILVIAGLAIYQGLNNTGMQ